MFTESDLRHSALDRLKDSESLLKDGRFEGAIYVCGYSVEIALKAKICRTAWWTGFPSTSKEFKTTTENLRGVQSHDLEDLLNLSGELPAVKQSHLLDWSIVTKWNPELRYRPAGGASRRDAELMIASAREILSFLGVL